MIKSLLLRPALFGGILALSLTLPMLGEDSTAALVTKLEAVENFQGLFHQRSLDHDGTVLNEQKGVTAFRRPNEFAWHIQEPYTQAIVLRGEFLTVYEPDLNQVTYQRLSDITDSTMASVLFGNENKIAEDFEVSGGEDRFHLRPRDSQDSTKEINIYFEHNRLDAIDVLDRLNHVTEFNFKEMKINVDVDDSVFEINLPPSVDVIGVPPTKLEQVP